MVFRTISAEDELRKVYAHEILEREKILTNIKEKAEKFKIQSKTEVLMSPRTTSTASTIVDYAEKEKVDLITSRYHHVYFWPRIFSRVATPSASQCSK
jgi:nucleotide-binding universal stress UspA family protein